LGKHRGAVEIKRMFDQGLLDQGGEGERRLAAALAHVGLFPEWGVEVVRGTVVDACLPDSSLIPEFGGARWHPPGRRGLDGARRGTLEADGWAFEIVTWADITQHPERTALKIKALHEQRAAAGLGRPPSWRPYRRGKVGASLPSGRLLAGSRQARAGLTLCSMRDRDRYVDLLRVLAIGVVVYGHWLIAVVAYADGVLEAGNLLTLAPQTQYLTWLFQVMPLFFLVGGYANAASWRSATRRGTGYAVWLKGRARRLLAPAAVLVACWAVLLAVLALAGLDPEVLRVSVWYPAGPLWFLVVYVVVVAAVPLTLRVHDRRRWRAVATLTALVVATDVARLGFRIPLIGWLNCLWVWMLLHQLGYWWQDGRLVRTPRAGWALFAAGSGTAFALVWPGLYAVNMVGFDHYGRTNSTPPTSALLALGVAQVGLALVLRRRANAWLRRPRVWHSVVAVNGVAMTLYLWHLPALVLVILAVVLPGLWPAVPVGTAWWWMLRPVWLATLTLTLLSLTWLFSRVEQRAAQAGMRPQVDTRQGIIVANAGSASSSSAASTTTSTINPEATTGPRSCSTLSR